MYLSIVIPAFNEASRIETTIIDIDRYLKCQDFTSEIIVVNDGSDDSTSDVVNDLIKRIPALRLIECSANKGKGRAIRRGMLEARGSLRLFTDADNSTRIDQVEKLLPYLNQGCPIVIGSRALKDAHITVKQPWFRIVLGKLGNKIVQLLAVPGIKDTQCGFKVFSQHAVDLIFPRMTIDGWGFDIEALAIARHHDMSIKEVGIEWANHPDTFFGLKDYLRVMRELCVIWWNCRRRKY